VFFPRSLNNSDGKGSERKHNLEIKIKTTK
jgi:hypothetical protein